MAQDRLTTMPSHCCAVAKGAAQPMLHEVHDDLPSTGSPAVREVSKGGKYCEKVFTSTSRSITPPLVPGRIVLHDRVSIGHCRRFTSLCRCFPPAHTDSVTLSLSSLLLPFWHFFISSFLDTEILDFNA
jgi:hypothetical protein